MADHTKLKLLNREDFVKDGVGSLCLHLSQNLPSFETPAGKDTALRDNIILQYLVNLSDSILRNYTDWQTHMAFKYYAKGETDT